LQAGKTPRLTLILLAVLLVLAAAVSVLLGRYPAPGFMAPGQLAADPLAVRLVLGLRLPRVLLDVLLGCVLGAAGTVFQMIFSNPLVEPGFLGVSQGAAFGAALCMVALTPHPAAVEASALVFALVGLAGSLALARLIRYGGWILRLVLAGIAVSAVFAAGLGMVKLAADPRGRLPDIAFWLLGSLSSASWRDLLFAGPPAVAGLAVVVLLRWRLNVLSLDERVAHALGTSPARGRLLLLSAATLATAAAVSVTGLVGWVGLMVPQLSRRVLGTDARSSLPGAILMGGTFVVLCDDVARAAFPAEIPLGVLTALIGTAVFLLLMSLRSRERGG
jgi:iron complex transport system permease protein